MRLRRRLAVALVVALVAGCGESDSKSYTAPEVRDALRQRGFKVEVLSKQDQGETTIGLLKLFSRGDTFKDVEDVVTESGRPVAPNGYASFTGAVEAWILKSKGRADRVSASCGEVDAATTCLQKRNVVVIVRRSRAKTAREALADLG